MHIHIDMGILLHSNSYIYIDVNKYINTYVYTYIYIYIYVHIWASCKSSTPYLEVPGYLEVGL